MSGPSPSDAPTTTTTHGGRKALYCLALLSCSALFWELALIRWVPGSVRVVGYFTNLILIASFLGLGVGALLSRHRRDLLGHGCERARRAVVHRARVRVVDADEHGGDRLL